MAMYLLRRVILPFVLLLLLASCGFDLEPVGLPPTQTFFPSDTAASTAQVIASTPTPSATLTLESQSGDPPLPTPSPTNTPDYTSTITITPWPNDTPTAGPSPTRTRTPTRTRIPTRTRAPSLTPTITRTPTITFTPTPPPPIHELLRPGLMSKVTTPIEMELYAITGADRKVTIDLIGEDGRLIAQDVMEYDNPGRNIWAAPELPFIIDAVSEIARLQISSRDAFGRLEALSSVELVLLSVGRDEIYPQTISMEPYLIRSPDEGDTISGGKVILEALARPVNDSPIIVELIAENGQILTSVQTIVAPPSGPLSHTPFTLEIPYEVESATPVRMVIRQEGSRIPGTVALNSLTLILEP